VITNEYPEDAHALYIMYKGREWIVMHSVGNFHAIAVDEGKVTKKEIQKLFDYLILEGFINPPQNNHNP
jgi:hypothetical protein